MPVYCTMNTAPKDGSEIRALHTDRGEITVRWDADHAYHGFNYPTNDHWHDDEGRRVWIEDLEGWLPL